MPSLDPGYAARQAQRVAAYDDAMAESHANAHLAKAEIERCQLCDDDGYRPNRTVCDHQDHTAAAKRGIAACRETLAKGKPQ